MNAGPGVVYRCFDAGGRLIYVGATSNLEQRLNAHRTRAWWYSLLERIDTEPHPTMEAAYAAEKVAIQEETPVFNLRCSGGEATVHGRLTASDAALCAAWRGYLPVALRSAA